MTGRFRYWLPEDCSQLGLREATKFQSSDHRRLEKNGNNATWLLDGKPGNY
jgi:hypothetical protein